MKYRHAPRHGCRWQAWEWILLVQAPAGSSHRELAAQLGRSTTAVSKALAILRRGEVMQQT